MESNKQKVAGGLFWSYGERILAQLVSLVVSIVLARLLTPENYGVISIVMIFITFCDAIVTGGFGNAIVQKKDADEMDVNTMLCCSIATSFLLYAVVFLAAPAIARFYQMDIVRPILRVLGLRLLISGVNSIQRAWIQKRMLFKRFFISTSFGTVLSAIVGIAMAYMGMGAGGAVSHQQLCRHRGVVDYQRLEAATAILMAARQKHALLWLEGIGHHRSLYDRKRPAQSDYRQKIRFGRSGLLRSGKEISELAGNQYQHLHQQRDVSGASAEPERFRAAQAPLPPRCAYRHLSAFTAARWIDRRGGYLRGSGVDGEMGAVHPIFTYSGAGISCSSVHDNLPAVHPVRRPQRRYAKAGDRH